MPQSFMSQSSPQYLYEQSQPSEEEDSVDLSAQLANLKPPEETKQDKKMKKNNFKWLKNNQIGLMGDKTKKKKNNNNNNNRYVENDERDEQRSRSRSRQKDGKSHHEEGEHQDKQNRKEIINVDDSEDEKESLVSDEQMPGQYGLLRGEQYAKRGKDRNQVRKIDRMFERQLRYYIQGKPKDQLSYQIFNTIQQYFR